MTIAHHENKPHNELEEWSMGWPQLSPLFCFSAGALTGWQKCAKLVHEYALWTRPFLGVAAISLTEGLSNADLLDAQIKIVMISVAKKVIVVADHRRVGQVHFAPAAPIAAVHKLVIGHGISPEKVEAFEEK